VTIFVTVGAQMPFDRLVHAVDAWAAARGRDDVLAQIGASEHPPSHVRHVRFLDAEAFERAYADASLVVAHAGTGSILAALERGTPIVVMPRRAALRETRNDHHVATARRFAAMAGLAVAWDEHELPGVLDRVQDGAGKLRVGREASPRLIGALRAFIEGGP
jgi:UDP-N-acetylglucosamine transferase subunit ALG13